ncbi:unnamed protein product [Chrysoparadoxa australica]
MGVFKKIASAMGLSKQELRILVVGLDNGGKTTLINSFKPQKADTFEVTPTVGFQIEGFIKNNLNFTMFDMSGQGKYRSLWEAYYRDVEAIIFVLDSTDRIRACIAKEELDELLHHKDIARTSVPILLFANKIDMPGAMTPVEIVDLLSLNEINDKAWRVASSNALSGEGVEEGMSWLADQIRQQRK